MMTVALTWMMLAASPAQSPELVPLNKRSFKIPILVEPERRPQIKQLILFVSSNQGQTWEQAAVRTPDQDSFGYRAPADGLYWFTVAVVDQQDQQQPADVYKMPPSQKILVDTVSPDVKIKSVERQGEEITISWEIAEENPDPAAMRVEYRPSDAGASAPWQAVPATPGPTGKATFKPGTTAALAIRIEMRDLAGNIANATREVPAGPPVERLTSNPPTAAPAPPAVLPGAASGNAGSPLLPGNVGSPVNAGLPPAAVQPPVHAAPPPVMAERLTPPGPLPTGRGELLPSTVMGDSGNRVVAWSSNTDYAPPAVGAGAVNPTAPRPPLPNAFIVNDPQISLEYEMVKLGSSGIGKVELWITDDDGKSWRNYADDPDLKTPITARLPGQGLFGLRLVTTSGAGLSEGPPQPGDAPEIRIEVDLTPPVVQLFEPKADALRPDLLTLTWQADDRNLAAKPVMVEFAAKPEGPWQPIATEQAGKGTYSWQPPRELARVYLRVSAMDTAGNRSVAETRESILVDLNKTRGRIVGIGQSPPARQQALTPAPQLPAPAPLHTPAPAPLHSPAPAPAISPVSAPLSFPQ
ncbi:MAG: hypothetical protein JNM56_37280 [Planctomycetia bacterium]|nr:hypothetical protein [Planctomycetia bacterium]